MGIYCPLFINRLPQELCLIISREIGDDEWRIDEIMTIVEREISARERAFSSSSNETRGSGLPTAAAMLTSDSQPKCSYCRQGHSSSSCTVITDVAQRKAILKRTGRCFVCLKRHHLSRDCRSPARCSRCNGQHHTSICKDSHVPPSNRSSGNSNHQPSRSQNNTPTGQGLPANAQQSSHSQTSQLSQTSTAAGPPNSTTTTGLYCVNADTPVLLQTAQAYIHKPSNPSCGTTIRLMLDGGSQRSYITQRVKDVLGLESERAEEMHIQTFGSENTRAQTVEMVKATISLKERGSTQVLFAAVPLICKPLSCQPIAYTNSSQVGDELQIDALIGSDHYWQLATGKVLLGRSGPTAIHTHLGWVQFGVLLNRIP